ncbi:iron chelate uptake ABC transporter family permease subunit [Clostridiaceae bacterium M8S5]|nr:iron chelate uptake ABC transporter family permease subunit [Clostridiaceae bacterium M8S5]
MKALQLLFTDYTLQIVSIASAMLGAVSGILGSFAVLRKQSLLGDAISHSALPGIALVFLLTGAKETPMLLLGALISGLIGTFIIVVINNYSKISFDSALGVTLSSFFGLGLVLLTYIQKLPNANQAGLESFIFGQASTLLLRDVYVMMVLSGVIILIVMLFFKEFKLISFDPMYAMSLGFSPLKINIVLSTITVLAIIIGLQSVGVILMSALLISPGVAARQWTNKLHVMIILAAMFGIFSGVVGTMVSSLVSNMPTGPVIVIIISIIAFLSILFGSKRGIVWQYIKSKKYNNEILKRGEML